MTTREVESVDVEEIWEEGLKKASLELNSSIARIRKTFFELIESANGSQITTLSLYFMALVTGLPVIAIGRHATFKTASAKEIAKMVEKRVLEFEFKNKGGEGWVREFEEALIRLEKNLRLESGSVRRNIHPYIDVDYTRGTITVDADYFFQLDEDSLVRIIEMSGFKLTDDRITTLRYFSTDTTQLEKMGDIFGFTNYPAMTQGLPLHFQKGPAAKADVLILNEILRSPLVTTQSSTMLDIAEKTITVEDQQIEIKAPLLVTTSNPTTEIYGTTIELNEAALMDRPGLSVEPVISGVGIANQVNSWKRDLARRFFPEEETNSGRIRLRDILRTRVVVLTVSDLDIETKAMVDAYSSVLSGCVYDSRDQRSNPKREMQFGLVDKIASDRDCTTCVFGTHSSICGEAAAAEPRLVLSLSLAAGFLAVMEGKFDNEKRMFIADVSDVEAVIPYVVGHRLIPWYMSDMERSLTKNVAERQKKALEMFRKVKRSLNAGIWNYYFEVYKTLIEEGPAAVVEKEEWGKMLDYAERNDDPIAKIVAGHMMRMVTPVVPLLRPIKRMLGNREEEKKERRKERKEV